MVGIEGRVDTNDVEQSLGDVGIAGRIFLDALLAVGLHLLVCRGANLGVLPLAPWQRHHLVLTGQLAVTLIGFLLRLVALETGFFMTGSTAEHATQFEEDHDRQNEKQ